MKRLQPVNSFWRGASYDVWRWIAGAVEWCYKYLLTSKNPAEDGKPRVNFREKTMTERQFRKCSLRYFGLGAALIATAAAAGAPQAESSHRAGSAARSNADLQALETQAGKAMRAGDFVAAAAAFEKLARADPRVAQFRSNLCVARYSAKQFPQAAAACRKALALDPSLEAPRYFLALSLAESGQCSQALPRLVPLFHSARQSPMKRQLGLDGVNCASATGHIGQETALTDELIRAFPDDPEVLYVASHVYSDLAASTSERLLAVAPGSFQAHEFNAEALEVEGKLSDAEAEYRKALEIDPSAPNIHYRLGKLLLLTSSGDAGYQAAKVQFEKELRVNPSSAAADYQLGLMAWRARDWNGAIKRLRRAAQLDPDSSRILVALGKAYLSAGQAASALHPLEAAVRASPSDATAHYELGMVFLHLGRKQEADRELALYRRFFKAEQAKKMKVRRGFQGEPHQAPADKPPLREQ